MKFITICHNSYLCSKIPITKDNEYIAIRTDNSLGYEYNIYTMDGEWVTVFYSEFGNYFYKGEINEVRNLRLINTLKDMKKKILDTISDLCSNFLYYDRKEDGDLSADQLKKAVKDGEVTVDEMVSEFRKHLENSFK